MLHEDCGWSKDLEVGIHGANEERSWGESDEDLGGVA